MFALPRFFWKAILENRNYLVTKVLQYVYDRGMSVPLSDDIF